VSQHVEEPLSGGSLTDVARVGDTVRRMSRESSQTIQELLLHLESEGFEAAPRALGFDDSGREVLSFVEGEVATDYPSYVWDDTVLVEIGRLMRQMHDCATSFEPSDARWMYTPRQPAETVCHNDVTPWNTVFRDRKPIAFIDWDHATPGPRAWDLSNTAWAFVPLWHNAKCERAGLQAGPLDKARRLRLFLDAYGDVQPKTVLETGAERMRLMVDHLRTLANEGHEREVSLANDGILDEATADIHFVETHMSDLAR
jgi:hypothetical protein